MTTITASDWTPIHVPINEHETLAIGITAPEHIILGRPTIDVDGDELAVDILKTSDGYVINADEVPPSTLTIPVKAVAPITIPTAALTLRIDGEEEQVDLQLHGVARFLPQRCKWTTKATGLGETSIATLRIRNDGNATTQGLTVTIDLPGDLRVRATDTALEHAIIITNSAGVPTLELRLPELAAGEATDLPLSVTRTSADLSDPVLVATVSAMNIAQDPLPITTTIANRETQHARLKISVEKSALLVRGERIIATVEIKNGQHLLENPTFSVTGDGIAPLNTKLGPLFPYEERSWPIQLVTTKEDAGAWTVDVSASIHDPVETLTADCVIHGQGNPVLTIDMSTGPLSDSLSMPISVTVTNIGLGAATNAHLAISVPDHIVAVADTLYVDGEQTLEANSSVPILQSGLSLNHVAPNETVSVTFDIRSTKEAAIDIEASVGTASQLHDRITTSNIQIPAAAKRPKASKGTRKAKGAGTASAVAPEPAAAPAAPPVVEEVPSSDGPSYQYLEGPSPEMLALVPSPDVEIGRYVLTLYTCIPVSVTGDEEKNARVQTLRDLSGTFVARGLAAVQSDSYGAIGYFMSDEAMGRALNAVRADLGQAALDPSDDAAVVQGMVELAVGAGDFAEVVSNIKERVITALAEVEDDEDYGRPLSEVVAA